MRTVLALLLCLSGCSTLDGGGCSVADEQIASVRQRCEAKYQGQGLESALRSLNREVTAYRAGGSCERFELFLSTHCD